MSARKIAQKIFVIRRRYIAVVLYVRQDISTSLSRKSAAKLPRELKKRLYSKEINMKSIEITASTYEEALEQALEQLGLEESQVVAEKISETGLIRKKVTVKVTEKVTGASMVKEFINGIIQRMDINCEAAVEEKEDAFYVTLTGEDTGTLIGYRGDVLDSLQYLSLLVVNKCNPDNKRLVIDGENYREKRTATLSKLAKKIAFRVAKSHKDEALESMNPFERRIIHSALHDDRFVTT